MYMTAIILIESVIKRAERRLKEKLILLFWLILSKLKYFKMNT